MDHTDVIYTLIRQHQNALLAEWLAVQRRDGALGPAQQDEAAAQSARFLDTLGRGSGEFIDAAPGLGGWPAMRELLEDVSARRVSQGFSPSQTASFVFSLREPLLRLLRRELPEDLDRIAEETTRATRLLDQLGLFTFEAYQKTREQVIGRQQQELLELSTPVVELWKGILALPLIGTLDS